MPLSSHAAFLPHSCFLVRGRMNVCERLLEAGDAGGEEEVASDLRCDSDYVWVRVKLRPYFLQISAI